MRGVTTGKVRIKIMVKLSECLTAEQYADILEVSENPAVPWDELTGKTVLITGAAGFIGYYLTAALLLRNDLHDAGIRVLGVVRNIDKAMAKFDRMSEREDLVLFEVDVCDIELGNVIFSYTKRSMGTAPNVDSWNSGVDYIIHAASQASAWHFENDPVGTMRANLIGTDNVLETARKLDSRVLIVSSLKVYGDVDIDSYKSCYAVGKRAGETLAVSYSKQFGVDVRIARPSYIFGAASLRDDRVWAQFIANVVNKENILLKSAGAVYRSFCYVSDTAAGLLTILLKGEPNTAYDIASEIGNISIRDFAEKAVETFPERNLSLSFANPADEAEPTSMAREILDGTKLEELGWKASVDISEGIRKSVDIIEADMPLFA